VPQLPGQERKSGDGAYMGKEAFAESTSGPYQAELSRGL
jgi:hypothetical protein